MSLSDTVKKYPFRAVCILTAAVAGAGAYVVSDRVVQARELLAQKTVDGERLETNVRDAGQLPEQLEALTSAVAKIQAKLIRAGQLANNLQYFYRLETESGVELLDVRPTGSVKGPYQGVGFNVSVKADYLTLLGYLRRLENGPHFCRILSTGIAAPSPDRAGPLTLSLSLELLGQP
ncbi:MAG: hypothetical protein ABIZ04_09140 [Opitutus sp.]